MYALVHHQINKPAEFMAIVEAGGKFPEGYEVLAFIPEISHKTATCVWEAPDTTSLKNFLDPILGDTASNTYLVVDEAKAMGLSKLKEAEMHA